MEIVLHVGPHKTGTTSLQARLATRYGSEEPTPTWYPLAWTGRGPGHARLAWRLFGEGGEPGDPATCRELVDRAAGGGCERLLLSAEAFSIAARPSAPGLLEALGGLVAGQDLTLLVTLSPLGRRARSLWQEQVKQGETRPLAEALPLALAAVGMRADFVSRLLEGLAPDRAEVVVVEPGGDPEELFRRVAEAVDLPGLTGGDPAPPRNRSWGRLEVELLRALNLQLGGGGGPQPACRRLLEGLFASPAWGEAAPREPLELPEAWREPLRERAGELRRTLEDLVAAGRVRIHGDHAALDDLAS